MRPTPPYVLLDFADPATAPSATTRELSLFRDPVEVIAARELAEVRPALRAAEHAASRGGHVVGFVAYEAAPALDDAMHALRSTGGWLAWFGVFGAPANIAESSLVDNDASDPSPVWIPDTSQAEHGDAVRRIRDAIADGDVYQVNHTIRLKASIMADLPRYWLRLRRAQSASFAAYVDLGDRALLSVSPELFFRRDGSRVHTRPMKGTAPRGRWLEEDEARAATLAGSEKERAENVMIVDLLRNDLGRVCVPGSVEVSSLFAIERYPTVLQMTSTVEGTVRPDVGLEMLFEALFPCGSVTGAPKIAATRAIADLEGSPRGVYCGTIGYLPPAGRGATVFNVAIRTIDADRTTGVMTYGAGGGVTWDSIASDEYDEALRKAAVLDTERPPIELLETMRLEDGRITRYERHLARIDGSARWFGFRSPLVAARAALQEATRAHARGRWRLRLLAAADGTVRTEATPLSDELESTVHRITLAKKPVSRHDPFLFHKTTHRVVYESRRADDPDAFDVLLWNEEEELTEFTIGNLVVELGGDRVTPPRDCGLLAGTFRAELLEAGVIRERVVHREDLDAATAIWLVNSVREWVRVRVGD